MKCLRFDQWAGLVFLCGLLLLSGYTYARPDLNAIRQADQLYQEGYNLHFNLNQDSLGFIKYQQAKAIYLKNKIISPNLVDAYFGIGIIYETKQNCAEALKAYQESLRYQNKLNLPSDSSFFYPYSLIGGVFKELNQFDSAYTYFNKAEHILQRYPKISQGARLYNEIGNFYAWFGNYQQSINYIEKALKTLNYQASATTSDPYYIVTCCIMPISLILNAN